MKIFFFQRVQQSLLVSGCRSEFKRYLSLLSLTNSMIGASSLISLLMIILLPSQIPQGQLRYCVQGIYLILA